MAVAVEASEIHRISTDKYHEFIECGVSSRRRDLVVKPRLYASAEVKEYWVIDVERARVIVHQSPKKDRYELELEFGPEHVLDGSVVGIGEIPVADILGAAT